MQQQEEYTGQGCLSFLEEQEYSGQGRSFLEEQEYSGQGRPQPAGGRNPGYSTPAGREESWVILDPPTSGVLDAFLPYSS